jgi:class 3 adenylate cyclase
MRPTAELAPGALFGGYRIEDVIGRGGMGVVYRATDLELERLVALKLIAPELAGHERFRERFLRESRLAASLDHPNVVPIHEAGEEVGRLYIAMRYVDGEDLRGVLARERTLGTERTLAIVGQVADALDAAHERGLVHRDVKPGNVLLDRAGHAYLSDFGLSKQTGGDSTLTGQLLGTFDYLAPEQIRGESVDRRSDQYALACLLYECLAGRPPFRRETEAETLWAHMQEEPPVVESYHELDGVFRRALAKAKDERYTSCRELIAATHTAIGGKTAGPRPIVREVRKTVTAMFVSLLILSERDERIDPETLRRVTTGAFADVQAAVERHGGTVETLAGDSVTAIFGLPVVHEDDAFRAIRATAEIKDRLARLAEGLATEQSMRLEFGIGVSSGEVVIGGETVPQLRTTGEPLTISSRLGHAAETGEVLVDERTRRLVRDAVVVEPRQVGSLGAFWLVEVTDVRPGHPGRFESPIVGRDRERRRLHGAFEQAVGDRSCQLFTVLGAAGVGKSRLVHAFLGEVADHALVAHGRCLPYGEGITNWPVREIVKDVADIDDTDSPKEVHRKLEELLAGEDEATLVAQRVSETIGLAEAASGAEESFPAVRTFFEAIGRTQPLVLVFDDIQWGEPTFLDLIEYVTDWAREAPILLLCLTRPELLDIRPGWAGGKLNATTVLLEPLSEDESARLVDNIAGRDGLDEAARRRVAEAAEGNPLFVEEMLALVMEGGRTEGELEIPPSIQALLAARLDQLGDEERSVIEAASVEGKVFHDGSIEVLAPELRGSLKEYLMTLVRKELIRPTRPMFSGEQTFGFRHLLIRDAAYESIPKEARAGFHERHAEWLEGKAGGRVAEWEEIIGYHLEQAYRYRAELGHADQAQQEIGRRAQNASARPVGAPSSGATHRRRSISSLARSICCRRTTLPGSTSSPPSASPRVSAATWAGRSACSTMRSRPAESSSGHMRSCSAGSSASSLDRTSLPASSSRSRSRRSRSSTGLATTSDSRGRGVSSSRRTTSPGGLDQAWTRPNGRSRTHAERTIASRSGRSFSFCWSPSSSDLFRPSLEPTGARSYSRRSPGIPISRRARSAHSRTSSRFKAGTRRPRNCLPATAAEAATWAAGSDSFPLSTSGSTVSGSRIRLPPSASCAPPTKPSRGSGKRATSRRLRRCSPSPYTAKDATTRPKSSQWRPGMRPARSTFNARRSRGP